MSKVPYESYEEVISAIINHEAPFTFAQHLVNGKVDEKHILSQIDHVETGYLEPKDTGPGYKSESFIRVLKSSIDLRDGSALIDIVKESRRYMPYHLDFFFVINDLFKKAGLCSLDKYYLFTDIPLTVGHPAHTKLEPTTAVDLATSSFQVMQSGKVTKPTRMRHRRIFESVLLAHPSVQRTVIKNTLGEKWLASLENTAPDGRYIQLHDILTILAKNPDELKERAKAGSKKMVENMKNMHKGSPLTEEFAGKILDKIKDISFARPGPSPAGGGLGFENVAGGLLQALRETTFASITKENSSPQDLLRETTDMKTPFIKFLGTDHLLGMVTPHKNIGYLETEAVRKMIQSPHAESDIPQLRKEILSYIHRSEFQKDIMNMFDLVDHSPLTLDTPTQRGERVIQEVDYLLTSWATPKISSSIYKDPAEIPREDAKKLNALLSNSQQPGNQPANGFGNHNPKEVKMVDSKCGCPDCSPDADANNRKPETIFVEIPDHLKGEDPSSYISRTSAQRFKNIIGDPEKWMKSKEAKPRCYCNICSSKPLNLGLRIGDIPTYWVMSLYGQVLESGQLNKLTQSDKLKAFLDKTNIMAIANKEELLALIKNMAIEVPATPQTPRADRLGLFDGQTAVRELGALFELYHISKTNDGESSIFLPQILNSIDSLLPNLIQPKPEDKDDLAKTYLEERFYMLKGILPGWFSSVPAGVLPKAQSRQSIPVVKDVVNDKHSRDDKIVKDIIEHFNGARTTELKPKPGSAYNVSSITETRTSAFKITGHPNISDCDVVMVFKDGTMTVNYHYVTLPHPTQLFSAKVKRVEIATCVFEKLYESHLVGFKDGESPYIVAKQVLEYLNCKMD